MTGCGEALAAALPLAPERVLVVIKATAGESMT